MKYLKTLGLLAVAAAALMAFAGTASATVITSGGSGFTGIIKAESEGHAVIDNPIATIECSSTFQGSVPSHGPGVTAKVNLGGLSFTPCTNDWHMTLGLIGTLELHYVSGGNATVTSTGLTIDATRLGITCKYVTNNTHVGTITGSLNTGDRATLHIDASIPFHSGSIFCGSGATAWTGSYVITSPSDLDIDN